MSRVTTHAVIRWLERVRAVDIIALRRALGPSVSDCRIAVAGCSSIGLTLAEAETEILPAHLFAALDLSAFSIRRPGYTLVCEGGKVKTVVLGRSHARPGSKPASRDARRANGPQRRERHLRLRDVLSECES